MKRSIFLLVMLLVVSLAVGCQADREPQSAGGLSDGYFKMNLGTEPPTLDSAEADDLISITVLANIMRGLTQYGEGNDVQPAYAQRWEVSPDGLSYVFYLRRDGAWGDGKPVTAHDFVYGWRRVLDPNVGSPYAFLLFDIENARAL
jgi:ABC-type oligopeptide transport system substrate-binding subunit